MELLSGHWEKGRDCRTTAIRTALHKLWSRRQTCTATAPVAADPRFLALGRGWEDSGPQRIIARKGAEGLACQ